MKSILIPNSLKTGDKVAIVSTARKIDASLLESAITVLKSWGLEVVKSKNLSAQYHQFCGTDQERAADFQWALNDVSIKAIICFRGGYGTVRILDLVDFSSFRDNPKWICGYSDVTALHNYLNTVCGVASMHSTMPVNFASNTKEALESFRRALFGENYSIIADSSSFNRTGTAQGEIVGGNLSLLYSLSGTKYDINTKDKILFIEDLDEYLYHVDRMMWNLQLSGKLEGLKGLIVGGMTDMNDNDTPFGKNAKEIIAEAVKNYDYPVCFDFPAGHIDDNRTIILNKECVLKVNDTPSIHYSS